MTKRRIVLILVLCFSVALLAVQALSQTQSSNRSTRASDTERSRKMTDAEKKREIEKRRKKTKLERERMKRELEKKSAESKRRYAQKEKELAKEGRGQSISIEQRQKNMRNNTAEMIREFLYEKAALGASEEQWKFIKPKLEKVRLLRGQATSGVGVFLAGGSSDNETNLRTRARTKVPTWQWKIPWKDKAPNELTEAQKLTKHLITLVENKNTMSEQFSRTMDALRKSRSEEAEVERQLSEVRKELREMLTTRQEAALVLMKWL